MTLDSVSFMSFSLFKIDCSKSTAVVATNG